MAYTLQQNGVAERTNQTLVEMARCMMFDSNLPPMFWAEAIATAKYVRNRCPSRSPGGGTLFDRWGDTVICVLSDVEHMLYSRHLENSSDTR